MEPNGTIIHQEILIPTSYGHIAVKTWSKQPKFNERLLKVLAVHGWSDNAGTFDRLFPLLPLESMYIVAMDLPGHGLSSHLGPGVPYTELTWLIAIKTVLEYFQWTKNVTIIAHSMGANASLEFAALFPEYIERLIMLDTVKPRTFEMNDLARELSQSITLFIRSEQITNRPTYFFDLDKAIDVIIETHVNGKLTKDAAKCLMHRAVEFSKNKTNHVVFKRDPRLNCIVSPKTDDRQLMSYLSQIKCELMIIRAKQTHHTLRCPNEKQFLDFYQEKCSKFIYHQVDGDHYVHLTQPTNVFQHINDFIQEALDQLRNS